MILYFSGTGNSRYVAEAIQLETGDEIISINELMRSSDKDTIHANKSLVFVTPSYAGRMPEVVREFIENIKFSGNNKAYFALTCGSETGNAVKYVKDICKKKDFEFLGLASIIMPDNHIMIGDIPNKEQAREIINKSMPHINKVAKHIKAGEELPIEKVTSMDKVKSSIVNQIFYKLLVKAKDFNTTNFCVGCGKCAKICPLNNITLVEGKPQWSTNCTHCTACINGCPFKAIEYGNKTKGKQRYFNIEHPNKNKI